MIHYTSIISIAAAVGALACGQAVAATAKIPADAPAASSARISTREHKVSDFGLGTRLAGTRTYIAGGKGSLAVGLLLGPIGVAGNAAHAAEVNRRRAGQLDALVQTDAIAALRAVREGEGNPETAADAPAFDLLPSLQIRFDSETRFHVGCLIQVGWATPGKREWRVRYSVELPGSYDSQSPEAVSAAAEAVTPCFAEANRLFTAHIGGGMQPGPVQPARMLDKPQKQPFVAGEYPARLIVPDVVGVVEYAPSPAAE